MVDALHNLLIEPLTHGFMRDALLASLLISLTCATLGVYVVHRQMAFVGDAMSHAALPGLALAYLNGWSLFVGALIADVLTALGIGSLSRRDAVREDTAIGIVFTGMFALGVLMMTRTRSFVDLTHVLFGSILAIGPGDLVFIGVVACIVLVVLALLHKELELTSFDPDYAGQIGIRPARLRFVLLLLLALTVCSCIYLVGVVLTSAMLITPPAIASLLSRRLLPMMAWSVAAAGCSGVAGLMISFHTDWSPGALIVLIATAVFVLIYITRVVIGRSALRES